MRYSQRILAPLFLFCLLLAGCGTVSPPASSTISPTAVPVKLNVFAAASLTESFNELKTNYQKTHPGVTLTYNFAGSQVLEQQLANGAADDVFASADKANMTKASDAGLVGSSQIFARNRLVVIVPASNPGKIHTLSDLAQKGIKIDVAAAAVPVGKYALQVLDNLGKAAGYGTDYEKNVKGNIVSQEDNVKAVVTKVDLGEVDAGIVYKTDVTSAESAKVSVIDIPDSYNVIAEYPIAVTKNAAHTQAAQDFVNYLLSKDGQAVLTKYHFISVSGT